MCRLLISVYFLCLNNVFYSFPFVSFCISIFFGGGGGGGGKITIYKYVGVPAYLLACSSAPLLYTKPRYRSIIRKSLLALYYIEYQLIAF